MTAEERVAALHARMDALRRVRERRKTAALGAGCGALAVCLCLLVFSRDSARGGTASPYSGAAMLFENAGGYVLAAVIAFMAGVVVTAVLIRKKNRTENEAKQEKREGEKP